MSSVFISYRRETAAGEARALFNDLVARLGQNAVFMDVDSISLGRDFRNELQKTLAACDLVLVIIDKDWAAVKDEKGQIRLENAGDFVRMEIETALKRDIAVTPVLVKGARMPSPEELPAAIKDLAYRNGFELSHSRWESDVREMIRRLNLNVPEQRESGRSDESTRLAVEVPPTPNARRQTGSTVISAGWLTRRRLLMTTAATAIAGALGSAAYRFLNGHEKEEQIAGTKVGPIVQKRAGSSAVIAGGPIAEIKTIAAQSAIIGFEWSERGVAPAGYIKGMALVYARVYWKFKNGNAVAVDMAKANTGDAARDALAWYDKIFVRMNMSNSVSGADTLRHLFVLLIGLGMRESSGRYCQGRDFAVEVNTADTADAGLFSTSYSIKSASPLTADLLNEYSVCSSGFEDVFREGLVCSVTDFRAVGNGDGEAFQWLSKECPAFAAEVAAVGLRHVRSHWGSIVRREAEVRPECDAMLNQVQDFVDTLPAEKLNAALL